MKRFLKLFIFLQTLILVFLFVTSIYNIYEKNNIINNNNVAYQLEDNSATNRGELYDELIKDNIPFEFIKNDLKSESIVYHVFKSPNSTQKEYSILASDSRIEYFSANKQDFQDSSGIFYTNPNFSISKNSNLDIVQVNENNINYNQILLVNGINLIVLLLFSIIVYFIFTSTELKKITLKKMIGFSSWKISKEYLYTTSRLQTIFFLIEIFVITVYAFVNQANWLMLLLILLICSFVSVIVNCLLMWLSQLLIFRINISNMLKNSNFNKMISHILIPAKFLFIVSFCFSFYYLTTTLNNMSQITNRMELYNSFANQYTSDGFNSDIYEKILKNTDERNEFSSNTKKLYTTATNGYLVDDNFFQIRDENKYLLINHNFYKSSIQNKVSAETLGTNPNDIYVLIPRVDNYDLQGVQNEIDEELTTTYPNYDQFYGSNVQLNSEPINTHYLYYENNLSLEYFSSNMQEFKKSNNPILIIDNGAFSGLFYADLLNSKALYFEENSLSDFYNLMVDYQLNDIVVPGSVLTPFEKEIENDKFVISNMSFFMVVFITTTVFVIVFSDKIRILADRKKYAIKNLLGFSFIKLFKSYIIFSIILIGLLLVLSIFIRVFLLGAVLLLFDLFILYWQYKQLVERKINNSLKGE